MMLPAITRSPPYFLMPRNFGLLSRPLRVAPCPFLCAMTSLRQAEMQRIVAARGEIVEGMPVRREDLRHVRDPGDRVERIDCAVDFGVTFSDIYANLTVIGSATPESPHSFSCEGTIREHRLSRFRVRDVDFEVTYSEPHRVINEARHRHHHPFGVGQIVERMGCADHADAS